MKSRWIVGPAAACMALALFANPIAAAELKVMKTGLGSGTITSSPPGLDCGSTCDFAFGSLNVTLSVGPVDTDTTFAGWSGAGVSCPGTGNCTVDMSTAKAVQARFNLTTAIPPLTSCLPTAVAPDDCTHQNIEDFLIANPQVNTAARFIAALPPLYKQNWILMSRSESLQTGTALSPRILLPSHDARFVFSIGMTEHDSFPGSHRNAIEYMQWDVTQKNFRFHEIVLDLIPDMHTVGTTITFPSRSGPQVIEDDPKCTKCHSTKNVPNTSAAHGTAPRTATRGESEAKNKPNWDAYDSWAGMTPFNRDRIYEDSIEEATFRHLLNLWNWRGTTDNDDIRQILEQLELQPLNLRATSRHTITRDIDDTTNDGYLEFGYEKSGAPAPPAGTGGSTNYNFNNVPGSGIATSVNQEGRYVTLRHTGRPVPLSGSPPTLTNVNDNYAGAGSDEGRGVQLFDLLGGLDGQLNPMRIADELINHKYATSDIPIDVRPIALAIARGYITIDSVGAIQPAITTDFAFFDARNGLIIPTFNSIGDLVADTIAREESLPRRKADIQKFTMDRTAIDGSDDDSNPDPDPYLVTADIGSSDSNGLVQEFLPSLGSAVAERREEMFRRRIELGSADQTDLGGVLVDRENYPTASRAVNAKTVALFRYFLEPLGVSVDKWSMNVRGRSRAYNFADVFSRYTGTIADALEADMEGMTGNPPRGFTAPFVASQANVIMAVNNTLADALLPDVSDTVRNVPTFTDIQRIFNKSCIECHGGLNYPPYFNHGVGLDFSEQEIPPMIPLVDPRWNRFDNSHSLAAGLSFPFTPTVPGGDLDADNDGVMDNGGGGLYRKVARLANEDCPHDAFGVTRGVMPCGGPILSKADLETITRWIQGSEPRTAGDPHIRTIDGVNYDFQAAGEFVLLSGPGVEIQARQTAIQGTAPYGPNAHTGLTSCVSVNGAIALRIGNDRVTYQPNLTGIPDPEGLELRIDSKLWSVGSSPVPLPSGGRIIQTSAPGGLQIEAPGGTKVILTPNWWTSQQLWHVTIDVNHGRGTQGMMGAIAPGNWLPALPDGTLLGPKPKTLAQRYEDLYTTLGNAWRVTDTTSLFDYAPGTSTDTFSFPSWPNGESPNSCFLPAPDPDGPFVPPPPPITPMTRAEATPHCAAVADPVQRDNCIGDVSITGEIGFAQTYLQSEQIGNNTLPTIPVQIFPEDDSAGLFGPVTFSWDGSTDLDGDDVTYRHCVWNVDKRYNGNDCSLVPTLTTSAGGGAGTGTSIDDDCTKLLIILASLLFIVLILIILMKKPKLLVMLAIIFLFALIFVFYRCANEVSSGPLNYTDTELQAGEAYFWKVFADDGKGGTVESETLRFELKE